ncbi:MAG: hypothetical protein NC213_05145 [Acetobacter sp.]|nr:hypothetical protein [Bacteroides sp.]MCM1341111.1 hypothetical protein [Acetobacter sp.]MCM1433555.1 hypothetical protein [Clostridiales bacterium]
MSDNSHESNVSKNTRGFLSFVLFVLIVILSLTACANLTFANKNNIKNQFLSYNYVCGVKDNVSTYAKDICFQNGINADFVDDVFNYDDVKTVVSSYFCYYITDDIEYSETAHEANIDKLCEAFRIEIESNLKNPNLTYDEKTAAAISADVSSYFKDAVKIPHMDKIRTAMNVGTIALYVTIGVSAFFVLSVMLITFFVGKKRFRSLRAISISFMSAGFYEMCLALIIYVIFSVKKVDLFPLYLENQLMSYINMTVMNIACCAGILMVISLILSSIVWKIRKNN